MEEDEALSSLPGEHALLAVLRRHAATGELPSWIHEVSAYSDSPFVLTAQHEKATAADGAAAWYFLYTPARKEGTSSRYSRTAGGATWVEERTRPVDKVDADGRRIQIGYMTTFSYGKRTKRPDKKMQTERLGWILLEVRLPDGHLCCAKLYASPRKPRVAPAPEVPVPAPDATAPAPDVPVSAPDSTAPAPEVPVLAPDATAPAPQARAPAPVAPPAPAPVAPPAPAPVAPPAPASVAPPAPAPVAPPAPAPSSPDKTWVNVLISNSPTKHSDKGMSKRVFQMLLPDEDVPDPLPVKRRLLSCTGWLNINPVEGSA